MTFWKVTPFSSHHWGP